VNLFADMRVYADVTSEIETDAVLIGRIVNGEPEAARALVERYTPALRRFASQAGVRPQDIDDLLQETWLRVVRSAGRYDPLQPFPRWLFTIAMNRIRSRWERDAPRPLHENDIDIDVASPGAGADARIESEQRATAVRSLVSELPQHLGDTILLRYFEELSEREVAQRLGIPLGTVKSRLHHGMRRLRSELERIIHA
jgi:RNA polymerase sigma-70 factor (ECF subfamily)